MNDKLWNDINRNRTYDEWIPDAAQEFAGKHAGGFMSETSDWYKTPSPAEWDERGHPYHQPYTVTNTLPDPEYWDTHPNNVKEEAVSAVHSPPHYDLEGLHGLEAIDVIAAVLTPQGFTDYCVGNVLKYTMRYKNKNGEEDLRKAAVYAAWAAEGL